VGVIGGERGVGLRWGERGEGESEGNLSRYGKYKRFFKISGGGN